MIGIAKKLEEIYFPDDPVPLHIDKRSSSLKLIQHLRNEAHRFGITHHRGQAQQANRAHGTGGYPGHRPGEPRESCCRRFGSIKGGAGGGDGGTGRGRSGPKQGGDR